MSAMEFDTSKFHMSHWKEPRGVGTWAFCPAAEWERDNYLDHVFSVRGIYAQAKHEAARHFAAMGVARVVVCP